MTKAGRCFLLLGCAQALHSCEEIYFHLNDFAARAALAAPAMPAFFLQVRMKPEIFAVLNIIVIVMILVSVLLYALDRPWAYSLAWIWGAAEIVNGLAHLTVALILSRYAPGSFSAPLLVLTGAGLLYQLGTSRQSG